VEAVEYVLPLLNTLAVDEGMFSTFFNHSCSVTIFSHRRRRRKGGPRLKSGLHHVVVFSGKFPVFSQPPILIFSHSIVV